MTDQQGTVLLKWWCQLFDWVWECFCPLSNSQGITWSCLDSHFISHSFFLNPPSLKCLKITRSMCFVELRINIKTHRNPRFYSRWRDVLFSLCFVMPWGGAKFPICNWTNSFCIYWLKEILFCWSSQSGQTDVSMLEATSQQTEAPPSSESWFQH